MSQDVFDGRSYVADTSAWHRYDHPLFHVAWQQAVANSQVFVTPVVQIEVLYSARNVAEFEFWDEQFSYLPVAPLDKSVAATALSAMRELAHSSSLSHRIPTQDFLVAAAAAHRGLGVLHYDRHFDSLCGILGTESRWLAAPGSI